MIIELSLDDENNPIDVVDEDYNIELSLEIKGDYQILLQKIMELKNEYREIIIMRFVNELSLDEISSLSGKKKINVRVLLHRALKALKELLMEDKIST